MERIAVISDIHGNMPALDATLADIERRGIARIVCLGDLVGKGTHSDRVVDICRDRCEHVVRGNWDDGIVTAERVSPAGAWHRKRLGAERLAYLGALPNSLDLRFAGRRVRLLHASPQGVYHRVFPNHPTESLEGMFASTEFTGFGFEPDVVGYGDIHAAYLLPIGGRILFNVGSVGNPLDLPLACYAILEGTSEGTAPAPFAIDLVRLPYDVDRAIREAEAEGMPELEAYVDELRTARYRGSKD